MYIVKRRRAARPLSRRIPSPPLPAGNVSRRRKNPGAPPSQQKFTSAAAATEYFFSARHDLEEFSTICDKKSRIYGSDIMELSDDYRYTKCEQKTLLYLSMLIVNIKELFLDVAIQ